MVYTTPTFPENLIRVWDRIAREPTAITVAQWLNISIVSTVEFGTNVSTVLIPAFAVLTQDKWVCESEIKYLPHSQYFDFADGTIVTGVPRELVNRWVDIDHQPSGHNEYVEPRFARVLSDEEVLAHYSTTITRPSIPH